MTGTRYPPFIPVLCLTRVMPYAACCTFGHRLFLTRYMLSLKFICDDAYSNKVSVSYKKIALATTNNMLVLVPISLPSAPITVDYRLSTFSDPSLSYTMYPEPEDSISESIVKVEALW